MTMDHGRERDDASRGTSAADGRVSPEVRGREGRCESAGGCRFAERGELNSHLHEDAERVADSDDEERDVRFMGAIAAYGRKVAMTMALFATGAIEDHR